MKAYCEKPDGSYEYADIGAPVCGEDFCDSCGDCLHCDECECRFWVIYKDNERNPFRISPKQAGEKG